MGIVLVVCRAPAGTELLRTVDTIDRPEPPVPPVPPDMIFCCIGREDDDDDDDDDDDEDDDEKEVIPRADSERAGVSVVCTGTGGAWGVPAAERMSATARSIRVPATVPAMVPATVAATVPATVPEGCINVLPAEALPPRCCCCCCCCSCCCWWWCWCWWFILAGGGVPWFLVERGVPAADRIRATALSMRGEGE